MIYIGIGPWAGIWAVQMTRVWVDQYHMPCVGMGDYANVVVVTYMSRTVSYGYYVCDVSVMARSYEYCVCDVSVMAGSYEYCVCDVSVIDWIMWVLCIYCMFHG